MAIGKQGSSPAKQDPQNHVRQPVKRWALLLRQMSRRCIHWGISRRSTGRRGWSNLGDTCSSGVIGIWGTGPESARRRRWRRYLGDAWTEH